MSRIDVSKALRRSLAEIRAYSDEVTAKPDDFMEKDLSKLHEYLNRGVDALLSYEREKGNAPIDIDPNIAEGTIKAINNLMFQIQSNSSTQLETKKRSDLVVAMGALQEFQNAIRNVTIRPVSPEVDRNLKRGRKVEGIDDSPHLGG